MLAWLMCRCHLIAINPPVDDRVVDAFTHQYISIRLIREKKRQLAEKHRKKEDDQSSRALW